MQNRCLHILFFFLTGTSIFCQNKDQLVMGKVSFITSNNIYVKFESTEHISVGDTLKFMNQINPCLLVTSKSSKSLVCSTLNDCIVNKGDAVYFLNLANKPVKANVSVKEEPLITETDTSDT